RQRQMCIRDSSQALVLCVFMGGLTIGSLVIGYFIKKIKKPGTFYFYIEIAIGVYAILFDVIFKEFIAISQNYVIPYITNPVVVDLYRMVSSSLLILPQVILLGTTFPLISSFLLRAGISESGKIFSYLYFTNTIGGCAGIFLSGFVLLDYLGLSETIYLAGAVNVLIALFFRFFILKRHVEDNMEYLHTVKASENIQNVEDFYLIVFIALLTGLSSFIYEICWIRMLSLVFGSSVHSFEIMLFSFLLGLALGGFYIRNKIDKLSDDISYLANIQILMGFFAVVTLPLYNLSFNIFPYFFKSLPKTEWGYHLYNFVTQSISIMIMFPATFFAGMTLPLITNHLVKNGHGERSIGYVYGANTIGAIFGVLLTVNILFPITGLKDSLIIGALIDILIGVELLIKYKIEKGLILNKKYLALSSGLIIILLGYFFDPNPMKLVSGVYRTGEMIDKETSQVLYYKEGKTASISVVKIDNALSIRTNGKSDSAISIEPNYPPEMDEFTIFLLGYLPMLHNRSAKNAVNIGLGTGVTSNILLSNRNINEVYTIEIEKEVVKAGRFFNPYNELVFKDRRSKIVIDDARNFFIRSNKKFDIIVSEPSNPWISGVASLFTKEFYKLVSEDLNDNGIFVQWLQLYEIDIPLMASVFKALSDYFDDYLIYATNDNEVLILAKKRGKLGCLSELIINDEVNYFLEKLGISSIYDIEIRKIGSKKAMQRFFDKIIVRPNSDFEPVLERKSPMTRFMNTGAGDFLRLANYYVPIIKFFDRDMFNYESYQINKSLYFSRAKEAFIAKGVRDMLIEQRINNDLPQEVIKDCYKILDFMEKPEMITDTNEKMNLLFGLAIIIIPYLNEKDLIVIWDKIKDSKAYRLMSEAERNWIDLFLSISKRDIASMGIYAEKILSESKFLPPIAKEYLITASFLSSVLGNKEDVGLSRAKMTDWFGENKIVHEFIKGMCE
ncbi:MAG: hypothetical protein N2999_03425, partial [Proteobacteria bacterium]|nr:hypothetical protein [Pseudomonadota bacterium]